MWEAFWDLETLDRNISISAISNDFHHASFILCQDFESLLPVMNRPDSSINELLFYHSFVLLISDMRQLNSSQTVMLLRDPIPDESK